MQILIDTNVLLDFLLEREPFQQDTSAPDLSSVAAPPNFGIDEADYMVIEKLKITSGKQRYEIPKDTKLKSFKSVAVWCAKMNKTCGFATLP